jgi:exodeoxyribonuclease VII small subunit
MSPIPDPEEAPGADDPGFEEARDELLRIVARLEAGNVPLSESMALWERGEELVSVCQRWLDGARGRIDAAGQTASTT